MKLEEKIVSDLAFSLKKRLIKVTQNELLQDNVLLVEENTCLENKWEEFCVATQDKREELLLQYKAHLLSKMAYHFNELFTYEKISIWIKTEDGIDWLYDKKENSTDYKDVPVHFKDCEELLFSMILEKAKEFDNDNIYRFLYLACQPYKEEPDIDDREQVYE